MSKETRDWQAIKTEYITGEISLRDLAIKHNIPYGTVDKHAVRLENWNAERDAFRAESTSKVRQLAQSERVEDDLTAYKMTFRLLKTAFDDYIKSPSPIKLRAIDGILTKGLALEGYETERKGLTVKDWRDAAGNDHTGIQDFATRTAEGYFSLGGDGSDSEPGAGWTD